jgi:hypothetical protein
MCAFVCVFMSGFVFVFALELVNTLLRALSHIIDKNVMNAR